MNENLLNIKNLEVCYHTDSEDVHAVNGISLNIKPMETLGLVGETGAGKTTTALSIMRLLPPRAGEVRNGEIYFDGKSMLDLRESEMQKIRGSQIAMIFQDPMTSLNPLQTVETQIGEMIKLHSNLTSKERSDRVDTLLEKVGISKSRKKEFPHQFSGGMKQRVVIAMALACDPKLIIADEPTTALDVTIQAQILSMLNKLKQESKTSLLLITHDLGVVAEMCDRVAIMYAGEIIETGTVEQIFTEPKHPYTIGLFNSIPNLTEKKSRLEPIGGLMPNPADLPMGCKFHPRCTCAMPVCAEKCPESVEFSKGHIANCWRYHGVSEVNDE